MIACLDVQYAESGACAAALVFECWESEKPILEKQIYLHKIEKYEPGSFYKRELPPLLELLSHLPSQPDILLIDGYCDLSADGMPGLGARLFEQLPYSPVIVGVAKNRFKGTLHAKEVFRGDSSRPLFVTSIGITKEEAAEKVAAMHGKYRIPTMLKAVDNLARSSCGHS
jgi:deoxyribonuclease V